MKEGDPAVGFGASSFSAGSFTCSMGTLADPRDDRLEQLLDKKLAEHFSHHAKMLESITRCLEQIAGKMETLADIPPMRPTSPKETRISRKVSRPAAASIASLVELESAFLQEVCDVRSERRRSHVRVQEHATIQVVPTVPDDGRKSPTPPEAPLPGLLNSDVDDADLQPKMQKRSRFGSAASNLIIMNQDTQVCILDSHTQTHLSFEERLQQGQ